MRVRWWLIFAAPGLFVLFALYFFNNSGHQNQTVVSPPLPIPASLPLPSSGGDVVKEISLNNIDYSYSYFVATQSQKIKLIANFNPVQTADKLIQTDKCINAINGGFYSTDDKPLGLVIINREKISSDRPNSLFNGYLVVSNGAFYILSDPPDFIPDNALQSGPLLFTSSGQRSLSLTADKMSRRMVAAITADNTQLVLMTIYDQESGVLGPRLADLPQIIKLISDRENLSIVSAINLDGGRASVYYSPALYLREINPVGSLFCVIP